MADLKGTNVAALIVPFTDQDPYATHDAKYGKGGFRSVDTIAERDAITTERKTTGMIVHVNESQLNYRWTGTAWVEWTPKGSIAIDAALSTTSTNPVQNKVITTSLNNYETTLNATAAKAEAANNTANAAIPKANIDKTLPSTPLDTNVPSTKLLNSTIKTLEDNDQLLGLGIANATDVANTANTQANDAYTVATAAIPKANIDTVIPENVSSASDSRVPSTKVIVNSFGLITNELVTIHDDINNATSTANNAIPKSKIDSSIDGNETDNTTVPGTGAIVSYIKANNSGFSTQLSNISSRVTTVENWKNTIGVKGAANGVAGLDASGKVPSSQLPSYVDDIVDVTNFVTSNPTSGMTIGNVYYNSTTKKLFTATSATAGVTSDPESDKIYVRLTDSTLWRWSGSTMAQVNGGLVLGTTSTTAFRGDYGNTLYTNFGSSTNLTATQAARDFFGKITPANEIYITGISVESHTTNLEIAELRRFFNGTSASTMSAILPSATTEKAGVMTAEMYKTLQEIELATFPLEMTLGGAGTYEVGSSTKPVVSIYIKRKGESVNAGSTITVTSTPTMAGSLNSAKDTWTASSNITTTTNITIKADYGSQSVTKSLIYSFKYKKYWGTSASATLTNANILALTGNTWADSRAMNATNFDCTGGKYPYYVIPASIYTGLEVWVGGLKNTDIVVSDITLTNASGASAAYKVIRLANMQTGVLSIQFK